MWIPSPVLQTPTHVWSQKHPVPLLSFTHFTICSIWAIWLPSLGQAWVLLMSHSCRLRSLESLWRDSPPARRGLWWQKSVEGEVSKESWQGRSKGPGLAASLSMKTPVPMALCMGGHLFLADFIPKVLCGPWLGTGQKAMAGWREARPFNWGGRLEHSTEVGSTLKLHTVAQGWGESTDKMDPNQPRLSPRYQPSIGIQVWAEADLVNSL